jgi:hypothetical protein
MLCNTERRSYKNITKCELASAWQVSEEKQQNHETLKQDSWQPTDTQGTPKT